MKFHIILSRCIDTAENELSEVQNFDDLGDRDKLVMNKGACHRRQNGALHARLPTRRAGGDPGPARAPGENADHPRGGGRSEARVRAVGKISGSQTIPTICSLHSLIEVKVSEFVSQIQIDI